MGRPIINVIHEAQVTILYDILVVMQSVRELEVDADQASMPEKSPEAGLPVDISAKVAQQSVGRSSPGCSKWFGRIRQVTRSLGDITRDFARTQSELTSLLLPLVSH